MQAFLEILGPINELSSLWLFYDSAEAQIRGLSSLGESYGALLVLIILGKLPVPTQPENMPTWIGLLMNYTSSNTQEIRVLETEFTPVINYQTQQEAYSLLHCFSPESRDPPPYSGKKKQLYVYCKDDYSPSICDMLLTFRSV